MLKPLLSRLKRNTPLLMVTFVVAMAGALSMIVSHAATPSMSLEAENGVGTGITITNDLSASGGKGVKFGQTTVSSFVTRSGSTLQLNGQTFRFSGANAYWMGLDDNIRDGNGSPTYPTQYRVRNAFSGAVTMKANVLRTHTLGISVGCANCIEPSLGNFNDAAFQSIDYAVQQAGVNHIKLIIPLTDQWRYYHGGKWNFVHWASQAGVAGVTDTKSDLSRNAGNDYGSSSTEKEIEQQFYTNSTIQGYYKDYISHILNHVNQYTGVALKNDPTVLAWETGNELFDAPTSWTQMIASHIKNTVGAKQLVADGSAASGLHTSSGALTATDVDIIGNHFYDYPSGLDTAWMAQDANLVKQNNKAYMVGEYGWSISGRSNFLSALLNNSAVSGDLYWALLPYKEDGTPEPHASLNYGSDDVPMYVPGVDSTMQSAISELTAHATAMRANNAAQ